MLYLVDGMQVKDPQFQTRSLDVAQGSISEMQVLTAGFDAEYGEAQSAVVNLVIKEGDPVYHGRIEQQSDFKSLEGGNHYQDYDYTEGSLSGPEPVTMKLLPKLGVRIPGTMSFFGSGTAWGRNATGTGVWVNTDRWYRHQVTDLFGHGRAQEFFDDHVEPEADVHAAAAIQAQFGLEPVAELERPLQLPAVAAVPV